MGCHYQNSKTHLLNQKSKNVLTSFQPHNSPIARIEWPKIHRFWPTFRRVRIELFRQPKYYKKWSWNCEIVSKSGNLDSCELRKWKRKSDATSTRLTEQTIQKAPPGGAHDRIGQWPVYNSGHCLAGGLADVQCWIQSVYSTPFLENLLQKLTDLRIFKVRKRLYQWMNCRYCVDFRAIFVDIRRSIWAIWIVQYCICKITTLNDLIDFYGNCIQVRLFVIS